MKLLARHWLLVLVLVLVVAGFGVLGALTRPHGHPRYVRQGQVCRDRGERVWLRARRAHPRWSMGRLYRVRYSCHPAGWWY